MLKHVPIFLAFSLVFLFAGCTPAGFGPAEPTAPLVLTESSSGETPAAEPTKGPTIPTASPVPTATETPPPTPEPAAGPTDGSLRAAYIGPDGNIWLFDPSRRSTVPITESGSAQQLRMSGHGDWIAFTRSLDEYRVELRVVAVETGAESVLVSADQFDALDPAAFHVVPFDFEWVPGSEAVLFTTQQLFEDGLGLYLYDDLRRIDMAGEGLETFLPPGEGGQFEISQDGEFAAIARPTSVRIVRMDGGALDFVPLEYEAVITYSEYQFYPQMIWGSSGRTVMVAIPPADPLASLVEKTVLWRLDVDSGFAVPAGDFPASFFGGSTTISPSFEYFAFARQLGELEDNMEELILAAIGGEMEEILYSGPSGFFRGTWSPEGRTLLYSIRGNPSRLYAGYVSGGEFLKTELDAGEFFLDLAWADENQFLYWILRDGIWQLVLADLDGGRQVLAEADGTKLAPAYDFAWKR